MSDSDLRPKLGEFNSIICFKAAVVGMEDALGPQGAKIALTSAGRRRGQDLVASLGLEPGMPLSDAVAKMGEALGPDGTKLCIIEGVEEVDEAIRVFVAETVCMAGEPMGTDRECSFTLGAVHGALEALTGRKLKGRHVESPWRGDPKDVFEFTDRI